MGCPHERLERRTFLGVLAVGLAAVLTGCGGGTSAGPVAARPFDPAPLPPVPPLIPPGGDAVALDSGPTDTNRVALTIDDGYCTDCVAGYVAFVERSGIHLTFSPNGRYANAWDRHAPTLRPLVEAGQVQIVNHTFSHPDLRRLPAGSIQQELEANEAWIARTFATGTRPYYRPPFGYHNEGVDMVAADVGFDRAVLWNGSLSDSKLIPPELLMEQARRYLRPGVILVGHANHPTILGLFDEITQLILERQLQPATLDEMFGTTRP